MSAKMKIPTTPHYVAFGRNVGISVPYSVSYSLDGVNWVPSTLPAGSGGLGKTAFGEDRFVAITDNNTNEAAYSIDGITWLPTTLPSAQSWTTVAYGGGKFVALAAGSNAAAYSTDGITWTATTLPASGSWLSVTYADGKFVAIARDSSTSAYSTNGITWNAGTMPSGLSWQQVAYGAGKFVALANGSSNFAYSTNGITWTIAFLPFSANWISLAYGDGKFVALVGNSSTSAYSLDGVSWTGSNMPSSRFWSSITYGGEKFVALASQSTTTAYSSDGITWTVSTMPVAAGWSSIAYGEFFQKTLSYSASSNGLWRDMVAPYVKVAGAWKVAKSAFIKVSGQWKNWFLQDGILDTEFATNLPFPIGSRIWAAEPQPDGKIVVAGEWNSPTTPLGLLRLNANGTQDISWAGIEITGIQEILLLPTGKFLLGKETGRLALRGINSNGALNSDFGNFNDRELRFTLEDTPSMGSNPVIVACLRNTPSGKVIVAGQFDRYGGTGGTTGTVVPHLIQLNSNGTLDTAFLTNIGTATGGRLFKYSVAVQADGKIVIGGSFTSFNGVAAPRIVRLNSDGTIDTAFMANLGTGFSTSSSKGVVGSVYVQNDGKILATLGSNSSAPFTDFNGTTVGTIVRLNSNGTLDTSFSTLTLGVSFPQILPLSSGKIFVYGAKALFNRGIGRLNVDGSSDLDFLNNVGTGFSNSAFLRDAVELPDGRVLVMGDFSSYNGFATKLIAQIGGDGYFVN